MQKGIKGYSIFSGYTFLIVFWLIFFLSMIENKLGWGAQYKVNTADHLSLFLVYSIFFIFGMLLAKFISGKKKIIEKGAISMINTEIVFNIVIFFMLLKFINIGDIPLLGNPMSRYNYSLGGFADYPSRFLPVMAISSFFLYKKYKKRKYLYYSMIALILPMLLMQRQDVVIGVLGILIVFSLNENFSISKIVKYFCFIMIALILLVGGGAVIRYGSSQLSGTLDMSELLLAVIHGDLTGASIFGAYITDNIKEFYYGMYSLGEYFSIFSPTKLQHGAELMRIQFTNNETAQSIAIPFSFYIDFGYWGIALFSAISGYLLEYFGLKYKKTGNVFYAIVYTLFFLELAWSIRSGSIPFRPIFVYQYLLLYFMFLKKHTFSFAYVVTPIVLLTFGVSIMAALVRF